MAITAVGAMMLWILSRKNRVAVTNNPTTDGPLVKDSDISAEDATRLEAELADLER